MSNEASRAAQTWQHWHEVNPFLFPLPLDLRENDRGMIGHLLNRIPLESVKDANRCPNPWEDLASMKFPAPYRSLFLACASVGLAWRLLASCGWGGATSANQQKVLAKRHWVACGRGDKKVASRCQFRPEQVAVGYAPLQHASPRTFSA